MQNPYLCGLAVATLLLFGSSAARGQSTTLKIDDSGKVVAAHEHHHAKVGHKITWTRQTGKGKPWFVRFASSPCAEGAEFGSDRAKTCTIKVACSKAGDAGCKAYTYNSATGPNAQLNDPDIIVDP